MTTYFIVSTRTNAKLAARKDKTEAMNEAKRLMSAEGHDCTIMTGTRFAALQLSAGKTANPEKAAPAPKGKGKTKTEERPIVSEKNHRGVSLPKIGGVMASMPVSVMPPSPPATKAPAAATPRLRKATAAEVEAAKAGTLPKVPDFSAETHKRFRKRLAEVVALVKAKDLKGLKAAAESIEPASSSRKILRRYADNALIALQAKA